MSVRRLGKSRRSSTAGHRNSATARQSCAASALCRSGSTGGNLARRRRPPLGPARRKAPTLPMYDAAELGKALAAHADDVRIGWIAPVRRRWGCATRQTAKRVRSLLACPARAGQRRKKAPSGGLFKAVDSNLRLQAASSSITASSPSGVLPRRGPLARAASISLIASVSVTRCTAEISRASRSSAAS
jgi:hypothetical protein